MPNLPSVASNPNSRSRRRQVRLQARRNAGIHYPFSSTQHWNNQNRRRRQLKQQAVFNLDEYYGSNDDQDHHFEHKSRADVYRSANGNRFSILQDHTTPYDLLRSCTSRGFTFRVPPPWTSEEDTMAPNRPSHDQYPRAETFGPAISEQPIPELITPTSICSLPQTLPYILAQSPFEIRMPKDYDNINNTHDVMPQTTTALTYSGHYTIPSPLLYHRRSPGLCESPVKDISISDSAVFHSQDTAVLDFSDCDKRFHHHSAIDHTPAKDGLDFVAAALPFMGDALHKRASVRKDILESTSISQLPTVTLPNQFASKTSNMHVKDGGRDGSEHYHPEYRYQTHSNTRSSSKDLAAISGPVCLRTSDYAFAPRHHRSGAMYDNNTDYLDTPPSDYLHYEDPIFKLWLDFDRSMQPLDSKECDDFLAVTPVLEQAEMDKTNATSQDIEEHIDDPKSTIEITVCPAPLCLALIPATCGQRSHTRSGLASENSAASSKFTAMTGTMDYIAQDFGLDRKHAHDCHVQYAQSRDEHTNTEHAKQKPPMSIENDQTSHPWFDPRATSALDEGYYSDQDSLSDVSEIGPEEAHAEGNDWDESEWDFLDE